MKIKNVFLFVMTMCVLNTFSVHASDFKDHNFESWKLKTVNFQLSNKEDLEIFVNQGSYFFKRLLSV